MIGEVHDIVEMREIERRARKPMVHDEESVEQLQFGRHALETQDHRPGWTCEIVAIM